MRRIKYLLFIEILFLITVKQSFSYDSYFVHPQINQSALTNSKNLIATLYKMGYQGNTSDEIIKNYVNGQRILYWFRDGGIKEDAPIYRANNHFHDPLKTWTNAGLAGNNLGLSSLIWAQDQHILGPTAGGDWSWAKARNYYYAALIYTDRNTREQKLADTFRSLGQVMHLLSDASVPAHTRNDIHVFPLDLFGFTFGKRLTYESWAQTNWRDLNYAAKTVDPSIFRQAVYASAAPVAISALWDQDKYNGTNPEVTWTTDPTISEYGLAEYTNANYFSEDTIFTDYPHPRKDYTNAKLTEQYARDGKVDKTWYIMGYQTERLAAYSYFWDNSGLIPEPKWLYQLDKFVYESYADNLVPRAVGYSAGLLDYFFRGNIAISLPSSGAYSFIDASQKGFTKITLLAQNITSNGDGMTAGDIQLVVKYKLSQADPFQTGPVPTSADFSYIVSGISGARSIPSGSPVELTFDLSQNPIPLWATDVYLQVVYHGKLGDEDGAVAVGFKDISEPTPVDLYNNMDRICLKGVWYTAGSEDAMTVVDTDSEIGNQNNFPDEWDIYAHDVRDAYLWISATADQTYASPSNYTFHAPVVAPGNLYRAYVLSDYDYQFNYSDYTPAVATDPNDTFGHASAILRGIKPAYAVKNQVDRVESQMECEAVSKTAPCDIRYYPLFYAFRGQNIWGPAGFIVDNPKYPVDTNCSWSEVQ